MRIVRSAAVAACVISLSSVIPSPAQEDAFRPDRLAEHLLSATPVDRPIPVTDLDEAYDYQAKLIELLVPRYGERVGYKAALTSEALQQKFHYNRPVLGTVLRDMMLRDRAFLDEGYAARPMIEADLMVMVKDTAINEAVSDEELLSGLEGIHPLIELPDMVFVPGTDIQPLWLTAINAGACKAVVGNPIILNGDESSMRKLGDIHASIMDKQGQVLASGSSTNLLGHPINVVRWIRDEVASRGGALRKGDVLWLGSLTGLLPAVAGESYQVLYTGLGENPLSIQVNIRKTPRW